MSCKNCKNWQADAPGAERGKCSKQGKRTVKDYLCRRFNPKAKPLPKCHTPENNECHALYNGECMNGFVCKKD